MAAMVRMPLRLFKTGRHKNGTGADFIVGASDRFRMSSVEQNRIFNAFCKIGDSRKIP